MTITVSDLPEPEYGVDYLRVNDTYYSWLLPYIEAIDKTTGKKIDLFDDVSFGGEELEFIEVEIARALHDLKKSGTTIALDPVVQNISDGTTLECPRSLQTSEVRNFIDVLLKMAAEAKAQNKFLSFHGQ